MMPLIAQNIIAQCYEKADSAYKEAETLYKAGKLPEAGQAFMRTARIEEGCPGMSYENLSMELANAAFCFEAARDVGQAMSAYSLLARHASEQNDSSIMAQCDMNKARLLMFVAKFDSAAVYADRAFGMYQAISDFMGIAEVASIKADQEMYRGRLQSAVAILRRVFVRIEQENEAQQPAADVAYKLGSIYRQMQRIDSAVYFMKWSLDYYSSEGESKKTADFALEVGDLLADIQDKIGALEYYGLAHEAYVVLDDPEGIAVCLNQRGRLMADLGRIQEGLADLKEAGNLFRLSGHKGGLASVLSNRATVFQVTSEYDSALVYYEQSRNLFLQIGDAENASRILNNIANVYMTTSRYKEAAEIYEHALTSMKDGKPDDLSATYIGLGAVYANWGRADKAQMYYKEALRYAEQSKNPEKVAVARNNIGGVYQSQGDYGNALLEFKQALLQYSSIGLISKEIVVHINIGSVLQEMGQFDMALLSFNTALSLAERILDKSSVATCNDYMAGIYQKQGNEEMAESLFLEAIEMRRQIGEREQLAHSLNNLAVLYIEKKQFAEAVGLLEESIAIIELLRMDAAETVRREYFSTQVFCYQNLILAHIQLGNYDLAFYYAEQSKAKHLTEQIAEGGFVDVPTLGAVQESLTDEQIVFMFSTTDINDITQMVITSTATDAVLQSKEQFLHNLLNDDQVRKAVVSGLGRSEIVALQSFIEKRDSVESLPQLLSQKIFYNTVKAYINLINHPDYRNVRKARMLGLHLYQFLLAPFTEQLRGKKEIIIIADGILSYLPFESLVIGGSNYLAQSYTVSYQHSFTIQNLLENKEHVAPGKNLLAFGVSDYSKYRSVADSTFVQDLEAVKKKYWNSAEQQDLHELYVALNYNQFSDLEYSKIETEKLVAAFNGSQLFCNADASETQLKQMSEQGVLEQYKYLHFSAHGISVSEIPEMSALLMYPSATDDGFLSLGEIAQLNLNADLVSLSACNTGVGKVYRGEGVVGIAQSFFVAGSRAVLATLWEVDEESTSEFIQLFYKYAQENGGDFASALTLAKRDFIEGKYGYAWSLPYFWTPFVLYGQSK